MKKLNNLIKINSSVAISDDNFEINENIKLKFTSKKIAFKIFYALKSQNKNQNDLAEILGVTPQNISKLLKGEDYKISTLVKIEEALTINLIDRDIYNKDKNVQIFIHIKSFEKQKRPLFVDKEAMYLNHTFDISQNILEKEILSNQLNFNTLL